jgi:hypothetical protein
VEESDESCGDSSALSEEQRQFDIETSKHAPSALGRSHYVDDGEEEGSEDFAEPDGVFLQEDYVSTFNDPRTRRSMIAL